MTNAMSVFKPPKPALDIFIEFIGIDSFTLRHKFYRIVKYKICHKYKVDIIKQNLLENKYTHQVHKLYT